MNRFKVTLLIDTWSADPTEWIVDSIADQLDDKEEELVSITVTRYDQESKCN